MTDNPTTNAKAKFDGETYHAPQDCKRLTGQLGAVHETMSSGEWLSLNDISIRTGKPEASISARLRDLRKPRFGSHVVNRQRSKRGGGTWVYCMEPSQCCKLCRKGGDQ